MSQSTAQLSRDLDIWYGAIVTAPAIIYVQLHTGAPGAAGTANVHSSFARVAVTNNSTQWPAASAGSKSNGLKISWGATTGLLGLVNVTHVSLWDAASGGNCIDLGALTVGVAVSDKAEVAMLPGALIITRSA